MPAAFIAARIVVVESAMGEPTPLFGVADSSEYDHVTPAAVTPPVTFPSASMYTMLPSGLTFWLGEVVAVWAEARTAPDA